MSVYGAVYGDVYGDAYGVVVAPPPVPVPGGVTFRVTPPDSLFSSQGRLWLLLDPYVGAPVYQTQLIGRAVLIDVDPRATTIDVDPQATIVDMSR